MANQPFTIWKLSPFGSFHGSSQVVTRLCTWPNDFHDTQAANPNSTAPTARYDGLDVATHSITMKRVKNSNDDPRSRSATITTIDRPHATSTGPRCLGSGRLSGPRRNDRMASSSRFSTR